MASILGRAGSSQDTRLPATRIVIVGNAGCGKTSVAHLLASGEASTQAARPTIGCSTLVTLAREGKAFVELWDVGAHERYKALRASFYADISGVIIVTDSTSARKQASVRKWAAEVAVRGRFAAWLPPDQAAANPGGLPVPCLVISNKADLRSAQSGLMRRLWARLDTLTRQFKFRRKLEGLLRPASSSRLPDAGVAVNVISASATQGVIDSAAVASFFEECLALRLSPGSPAAKNPRRTAAGLAVQQQDAQLLRKPPLPSTGPPPPTYALANGPAGPHSTASSWGGFSGGGGSSFISRTASFHSTVSSTSDYGAWDARRAGDAAVDDSDDLV